MAEERIAEQRAPARLGEPAPVLYPDSDGLPMAENDEHRRAILSILTTLELHFQGSADTYVTGDLLLYYEEGNPRKCVAPDAMVALGVRAGARRTYLLWEEGKPPDFVAEVSSPGSRKRDRTVKRELYTALGVREYFVFDPVYEDREHEGELRAYRRWGSALVEVEVEPAGGPELRSDVLGLGLRPEGKRVRMRDLRTGLDLLLYDEQASARRDAERQRDEEVSARRAAERQRDEEASARRAAEARVAELEALVGESNTSVSPGAVKGKS